MPCYEYKAITHSQGPDYVVLGERDKRFMNGTVLKVNSVSAHYRVIPLEFENVNFMRGGMS